MADCSAIVLDVDGTLLNSQCHLSSANLEALRQCAGQGIALYVATARPRRLVFRPGEVAGDAAFLTEKGVFYIGAVAVDETLGYYHHWPMSAELVRGVVNILETAGPDVQIAIQHEDDYHSFRLPMPESELAGWGFSLDELVPLSDAVQREASKLVAFHKTLPLSGAYGEILARYGRRLNVLHLSADNWVVVTSSRATKENALLRLLAKRNISAENVVVFGDDMPDLGMFRTFGTSVAMAHAPVVLKDAASYVTRSNDDDGVAHALMALLQII